MFEILIESKVKKTLLAFDAPLRLQIAEEIYGLQTRFMDGKRLTGKLKGKRSWRSGDYRIIYDVEFKRSVIRIIHLGHRKDVYRKS